MIENKPFSLSVKVLIKDEESRYLLLRRSKLSKSNGGKWEFPGGKLDPGETFDAALVRETLEETGLTISILNLAGCEESESPEKRIAYLIMEACTLSGEVRLSDEHDEFAWVRMEDMPDVDLAPQFRRFVEDWLKKMQSTGSK